MQFDQFIDLFLSGSRADFISKMKAERAFELTNELGESVFYELMPFLSDEEFFIFVSEGTDVNLRTEYGGLLAERVLECTPDKDSAFRRICSLIEYGLKPEQRGFNGNTLMHFCVRYQNKPLALELKRNNISFLVQNCGEQYPSDLCVGRCEIAELVREWEYKEADRKGDA